MEDAGIIELLFARSEQGIRELDAKYGGTCRRLSYNIVNDWQDAEECVNDAYLGAWNAIPPARPDPLAAYLCRIVRNISLNACHRREAAKRGGRCAAAMEEIEVDETETARAAAMYAGSELAEARGWTDAYLAEHFVAVRARYYTAYDRTKTFMNDGYTEQYFYLTRDARTGKWGIAENTAPNTGARP